MTQFKESNSRLLEGLVGREVLLWPLLENKSIVKSKSDGAVNDAIDQI